MRDSFQEFARKFALVVCTLLLLIVLWQRIDTILLAFAGLLVAIVLCRITGFLSEKSGLNWKWSIFIVLFFLTGILVGAGLFLQPRIAEQIQQLSQTLPQSVTKLEQSLESSQWGTQVSNFLSNIEKYFADGGEVWKQILGVFSTTVGFIISLLIVLFIGVTISLEPKTYLGGLVALFPKGKRPRVTQILGRTGLILGYWLLTKIIAMAIVGILTGIGLWLLGIPLVFTLSLITALLTFIPNFGPVISAIPPMLLGLVISPVTALYVALLYLGVQTVESYFITPLLERKTVYLPPALTITVQIIMGIWVGALGLVVASPLAAFGMVLVQSIYIEGTLKDESITHQIQKEAGKEE
jgi:predicted PurR-regulated permease PerM